MKLITLLFFAVTFLVAAVDINNASKSELMNLKGIGAKKADAIIIYRKDHCFKDAQSLKAVKGIGVKTVAKNRDKIKVGACRK